MVAVVVRGVIEYNRVGDLCVRSLVLICGFEFYDDAAKGQGRGIDGNRLVVCLGIDPDRCVVVDIHDLLRGNMMVMMMKYDGGDDDEK